VGLAVIGMADALEQLQPDLMFVLGDRFEMLAAASAAMLARVPIAHAHGGETTEGAFDEAIRHSITKMSHLHFVAAREYGQRVVQLGEDPARVFVVGGLGIDSILRLPLLDREQLQASLGYELGAKNLLVTFHPVTLENATAAAQMSELLAALDELSDTRLIFTMSNADTGGRVLMQMIEDYVATRPQARAYTSLGQLRYLSCVKHVDGVVGNSSSGLIEVPVFRKGTINIGDRQRGRLKAASVIDCVPERHAIGQALEKLYSPAFQQQLAQVRNPYGEGGASDQIVQTLLQHPLDGILKKTFHDLPMVGQSAMAQQS
jgi:GDP/UDP-N,N'-diacetylbacillosamine 2-epimerase (hydrolysing)